jgi:hypothetical protein
MINLKDVNWRCVSSERTRALGVWPNQLWHNVISKEGAVVVQQSNQWGDYALSRAGFKTIRDALAADKLSAGFVVLQNREHEQVACKSIDEMEELLRNIAPRTGRLGDFWWLRSDASPADSMIGSRELADEEIPF